MRLQQCQHLDCPPLWPVRLVGFFPLLRERAEVERSVEVLKSGERLQRSSFLFVVEKKGLCQKSDFGPAYHKLGSYQVSI